MSSIPSEEDVKWAAYAAGIKNPARLNAFMRLLNLYVYATARKINGSMVLEEALPAKLYPCRGCGSMKPIDEFSEEGVNCMKCQGKRRYKCIGLCGQLKPLDEFPEHKQANPHIPAVCTYCAPKVMSRKEPP